MAFENWAIYAVFALFAFGFGNFMIKLISDKVALPVIMLFFYVFAVVIGAVFFVVSGAQFNFPISHALLAMAGGSFFAIGLIFASKALQAGTAVQVVPLFNLNTVVAVVLAILVLGEKLNLRITAGIVLALISVYLLAG